MRRFRPAYVRLVTDGFPAIDGMVHQTQTQKEIVIHFLSFSSFFAVNIGAAERIRTPDQLITGQPLYQLSYSSM